MSLAFRRLAKVVANTKRAPVISGGKRGAPATNLIGLRCLPLDPVSAELAQRVGLSTPHETLQTAVDAALDVKEGDVLVVGSREYPIRACEEWEWRGSRYLRLVL